MSSEPSQGIQGREDVHPAENEVEQKLVAPDQAPEAEVQEDDSQEVIAGPGVQLCEAREKLGFNRAKVGQQLGLTETAVKDLEKNYFDRFPSSVYVRGYLKNYAKMLGISEFRIIENYDRFCLENNLDSGKSTLDSPPERSSSLLWFRAFAAMGVVALMIILAYFYAGR